MFRGIAKVLRLRATAHVAFVSLALGSLDAAGDSRPNILFLVTDDQRWDAMGCAGNPVIQTPNMDRLAKEGTLFRNAFATTAICCASRASLLTGMYASTHGIEDFATPLPDALFDRTYPVMLRAAGYHTGFVGKWGVGSDLPTDKFDTFQGFAGQGQYFNEIDGETLHMTRQIGNQAVEYLQGRDPDVPFCLSVSFKAPHVQDGDPRQFLYDPAYGDLYADARMPVAETATEAFFQKRPPFVQISEGRVRWRIRFPTPERRQESIRGYYRLVTGIDTAIGRMLDALRDNGLADNTVVILTSDHGFFLGEHGLAGKWLMYEESIRVPLIVYDPRLPRDRRRSESDLSVLNIDLAPTVLEYAGVSIPASMQGRSLVQATRMEKLPEWRDAWYYEHHFGRNRDPIIPATEGVRTSEWKYLRYVDTQPLVEELYRIAIDPLETENLVDRDDLREVLARMRASWKAWRESLKPWHSSEAADWSEPR